ncbi:MAG TPA: hypothetical protein VIT20_11550 [Propionibacteriaceae bacterium]
MTASTQQSAVAPVRSPRRQRLLTAGRTVVAQTLAEPVATGRLRDDGWPYGLRAIVVAAYVMFGLAALTVAFSGRIRSGATLVVSGTSTLGLPRQAEWVLIVLLGFGVALFLSAVLHAPWWGRLIGLVLTLMLMGAWSLRGPGLTGSWVWPVLGGASMVALLVFVIVRWRRSFVWWEFVVVWGLVGAATVVGVYAQQTSRTFGYDFTPLLLQQTAAILGTLALPAATLAGAAVAEIAVRATVSATQTAQRLSHRRWPYVILAVVLAARLAQVGWLLAHRDAVAGGWATNVTALVLAVALAGVAVGLLRIGRSHPDPPEVSTLSDELGRVGFGVGAALLAILVPIQVVLVVVQVLLSLDPQGPLSNVALNVGPLVSEAVDPIRIVVALALLVLAVVAARRGQRGRALMLGCIAVMLIALARTAFLRDVTAAPLDQDALNVIVTGVAVMTALVCLVRRRLTANRAVALAGVLILSGLFSYRNFISDPLGAVLGFSGAALVLFGLTWDLLTGSHWGNTQSRRFPRPTRVMLVLTNSVLTMLVLAYAALVRDGSTTVYLDPYAEFGDVMFGTALLAAAVIAVLAGVREDRPIR